jgi:hypothetical protein
VNEVQISSNLQQEESEWNVQGPGVMIKSFLSMPLSVRPRGRTLPLRTASAIAIVTSYQAERPNFTKGKSTSRANATLT